MAVGGFGESETVERFTFVALLDALTAGRGELPSAVRRVTLELCRRILGSDVRITDD